MTPTSLNTLEKSQYKRVSQYYQLSPPLQNMMTISINGDSTTRPNPTVQIPPWDYHADPTAQNHFLLTPNSNNNNADNHISFETLTGLQRYLPSNNYINDAGNISDDLDIPADTFSCDHFRMYEFKIRKCTRGRPHDWTECPFAHSGEKARRRDPRKFHYSGNPCPEFRKGYCSRGDACEYAHGVFECWLHPARYRTQPCKDGIYCRRRACFFAHTPDQLRILPLGESSFDDSPRRRISLSLDSFMRSGVYSSTSSSPFDSPSGSPSSLSESMRSMHIGKMPRMNNVNVGMSMSPPGPAWSCKTGFCSPRSPGQTRPVFMSLPTTPTRRPTQSGLGMLDIWDQEEPANSMERVESGRDLRAKIYSKLSKENSFESGAPGPDVGWVSELLK